MMEIESVTVIPMSKESKWEDMPAAFQVCFITTSFKDWYINVLEQSNKFENMKIDEVCIAFAKKQQAFMLAPTGIFGQTMYVAKTRIVETLDGLVIDGPLYHITTAEIDDMDSEKTVQTKYIDPVTFELKEGPWYSKKQVYKVRYGVANV